MSETNAVTSGRFSYPDGCVAACSLATATDARQEASIANAPKMMYRYFVPVRMVTLVLRNIQTRRGLYHPGRLCRDGNALSAVPPVAVHARPGGRAGRGVCGSRCSRSLGTRPARRAT